MGISNSATCASLNPPQHHLMSPPSPTLELLVLHVSINPEMESDHGYTLSITSCGTQEPGRVTQTPQNPAQSEEPTLPLHADLSSLGLSHRTHILTLTQGSQGSVCQPLQHAVEVTLWVLWENQTPHHRPVCLTDGEEEVSAAAGKVKEWDGAGTNECVLGRAEGTRGRGEGRGPLAQVLPPGLSSLPRGPKHICESQIVSLLNFPLSSRDLLRTVGEADEGRWWGVWLSFYCQSKIFSSLQSYRWPRVSKLWSGSKCHWDTGLVCYNCGWSFLC